jgi:hypothetical protein
LSNEDDVIEGGEAEAPRARRERGLGRFAMRELRRAHKLVKDGEPSAAEANFLVASANVLATLDLASAIREAKRDSDD